MELNFFTFYGDERCINFPTGGATVSVACRDLSFPTGSVYLNTPVGTYTHFTATIQGVPWVYSISGVELATNGKYNLTYAVDPIKSWVLQGGLTASALRAVKSTDPTHVNKFIPFDVTVIDRITDSITLAGVSGDKCVCIVTQGTANSNLSIGMNLSVVAFTAMEFKSLCSELFMRDYSNKVASIIQSMYLAPVDLSGTTAEPLYFFNDTGASVGTDTVGHCITSSTARNITYSLDNIWSNPTSFLDFAPYTTVQLNLPFVGTLDVDTASLDHSGNYVNLVCDYCGGGCHAEIFTGSGRLVHQTPFSQFGSYAMPYKDRSSTAIALYSALGSLVTGQFLQAGATIGGNLLEQHYSGCNMVGSIGGLGAWDVNKARFTRISSITSMDIDTAISVKGGGVPLLNVLPSSGCRTWYDVGVSTIVAHPIIADSVKSILSGGIIG